MQKLDRFDGVVIVTTNLFENYDPALLRRIQRHIHFRLPSVSMRRELFALHLPNPERVQADYAVLAELSRGLSGGDILNICVNAIHPGSMDADPAKWKVAEVVLEREIARTRCQFFRAWHLFFSKEYVGAFAKTDALVGTYPVRVLAFSGCPDALTVFHELCHARHWKSLGGEAYDILDSSAKELVVYREILRQRHRFSRDQLLESMEYAKETFRKAGIPIPQILLEDPMRVPVKSIMNPPW